MWEADAHPMVLLDVQIGWSQDVPCVAGWRVQPKVLENKQERRRTRRESEICRFLDGL